MKKWIVEEIVAILGGVFTVLFFLFIMFWMVSCFSGSAFAAPLSFRKINVNLVVANGPGALTKREANQYWKSVQVYYAANGIPMRRNRLRVVPDYFAHYNHYETRLQQLKEWGAWLGRNGLLGRRVIAHVITPLLDEKYFGGYASGGFCRPNSWSVGNMALKRIGGGDGKPFGTTVMAHEMAHMLGADHRDQPAYNLMNTNILPLVATEIPPMHYYTRAVVGWCYSNRYAVRKGR